MVTELFREMDINDLPDELWKDIPGLEGYGMISNYGRVKRLQYELLNAEGHAVMYKARIQKQRVQRRYNEFKKDYKEVLQARIQINKQCHYISVGRIVYYCFVEKFDLDDNSIFITYKDGNGLNPIPDNLLKVNISGLQHIIMATQRKDLHFSHSKENQERCIEKARLVRNKKVMQYDLQGTYIATYDSISIAAKATGINLSSISLASKKKRYQTAGGFIWSR
jgi:hypothetical protein